MRYQSKERLSASNQWKGAEMNEQAIVVEDLNKGILEHSRSYIGILMVTSYLDIHKAIQ